jgi:hypothetical protein
VTKTFGIVHILAASETAEHRLPQQAERRMATVLAGPRIGEHVACRRGQSKCVVKFAIAQLITNRPITLTGYLRFPEAAGLFRPNVEHARRLWFARDHLAMAQALGWDRVASFYIDLEAPVPPSGIPKPGPLQMHLPDRLSEILPVGLICRSQGASGWAKARLRRAQTGRPPFPKMLPDRTCRGDVKLDAIDPEQSCQGPKPTGNCSGDPVNKLFDVITRRTILKVQRSFFVRDGASGCHMTPSERQRVQRTLEQLVYESLEN